MNHLYRNAAQILRANGYAPAAIPTGHRRPIGAWAVMQHDYSAHEQPESTASAAVLTYCRPPRGPFANVIMQPARTWLATLTVNVKQEIAAELEAIIAKHIGTGESPLHVENDGSTTRLLRLSGSPFEFASIGRSVCIKGRIASFVAIAGEWRNGDPLTVRRDDLPEIDRTRAAAMISEIDKLLLAHTPVPSFELPPSEPAPVVASLPSDADLRYGNRPAINKLRENGYEVCAVPWGAKEPASDDWKRGLNGPQFDAMTSRAEDGVGIVTAALPMKWAQHISETWIATLTLRTALREVRELVVAQLGNCPVRESSDGTLVFMLRQDGRNTWPNVDFSGYIKDGVMDVPGTSSAIRIESRNNVLVVSGLDAAGMPYGWRNGDPLSVPRAELPMMNENRAWQLVTEVQRLMERLSLERAG